MAPKGHSNSSKVVSSVVKTKTTRIFEETTIKLGLGATQTQLETETETEMGVVSTVVEVEVATPPPTTPPTKTKMTPPPVVDDSQEMQDPNEGPEGKMAVVDVKKSPELTKKKPPTKKKRSGAGKRRSVGDMDMGYRRYVYRVLKQVHPELGMSGRAMEVLDMMMADMFFQLAPGLYFTESGKTLLLSDVVAKDPPRPQISSDVVKQGSKEDVYVPEDLYLPGTLYYLQRDFEDINGVEDESYTLWRGDAGENFQRILLSGNLMSDHKCDSIHYALRDVLKTLPLQDN